MNEVFFEVAVNAPLNQTLTYSASGETTQDNKSLQLGASVVVPLGKRKVDGIILKQTLAPKDFKAKSIQDVQTERPVLSNTFLNWAQWVSNYYVHPIGQVLQLAFPPLKKQGRIKLQDQDVIPTGGVNEKPNLTAEQKQALDQLREANGFQPFLLHGVTGSGKTEVYLQFIESVLECGKTALVLVPEISLTPQLLERFAARFEGQVAVIHSQLTDREKTNQWWSLVDGKKRVLIGARSALFCPLPNLGAIIVDEEHEASFKQDEKLKYNARDAAIVMAKMMSCPIILGSATPSLESWHNCTKGKYQLLKMPSRVMNRKMPAIHIIDLKKQKNVETNKQNESHRPFWLSPELFEGLQKNYEQGFQAALFLNRRGVAQLVVCTACGDVLECPNCAISLTLHGKSHLVCHYCDYSQPLPEICPTCDSQEVESVGLGTELIQNDLQKLFPNAQVARADRDEISNRKTLELLISEMNSGKIDFLVGTQMIAKGLDFPNLQLVGLVLADIGFHLPDFRATERSFQLITQMSGRAGRHFDHGGQVYVQTYNPDHPSIVFAMEQDYFGFADFEIENRNQLGYPPFGKIALIKFSASSSEKGEQLMKLAQHRASKLQESQEPYSSVQLLGPCPAPLSKIRNKYRYQFLLKCSDATILQNFCKQFIGSGKWASAGTKVQVDIDPMNML